MSRKFCQTFSYNLLFFTPPSIWVSLKASIFPYNLALKETLRRYLVKMKIAEQAFALFSQTFHSVLFFTLTRRLAISSEVEKMKKSRKIHTSLLVENLLMQTTWHFAENMAKSSEILYDAIPPGMIALH